MKQILLCSFVLAALFCTPLFASATKTVTFNGQTSENVSLSFEGQETRYRNEVVNSTCTRQVPDGVQQICEQVLRYRQECRYEPSRQDCHYTSSREECYYTPSRQDCHYEGGGVVCTIENGRRICRNEPGHQVCRTIPGERVCRTIPGQYVCETIPGRNVCNQVPYYETVCHNETRYRTESYSCQKTISVPYSVRINHDAQVEFNFENAMSVKDASISVNFEDDGVVTLKTNSADVLVLAQKEGSSVEHNADTFTTHASYRVTFLPKERVLSPVKLPAEQVNVTQDQLSFVIGKSFNPSQLKVTVNLHAKRTLFHKEFDVTRTFNGTELRMIDIQNGAIATQSTVVLNLKDLGIELPKRKFDITINTAVELKAGQVINNENLVLTQTRKIEDFKLD